MKLEQAKQEFNLRYYYWAWEDFKREIDQGFPFLREFKTGSSCSVVHMMSEMTRGEQLFFAKALLKRFHKEAVQAVGDSIIPEETVQCEEYHERSLALANARADLERKRMLETRRSSSTIRGKLRRCIKVGLAQLNMERMEPDDPTWKFSTPMDGWNIVTAVDTAHRYAQLMYHHDIQLIGRKETWKLQYGGWMSRPISINDGWISLNAWLGISSQTQWGDLKEAECAQAAKHLAKLCSHFLQVAPALLKGLQVD